MSHVCLQHSIDSWETVSGKLLIHLLRGYDQFQNYPTVIYCYCGESSVQVSTILLLLYTNTRQRIEVVNTRKWPYKHRLASWFQSAYTFKCLYCRLIMMFVCKYICLSSTQENTAFEQFTCKWQEQSFTLFNSFPECHPPFVRRTYHFKIRNLFCPLSFGPRVQYAIALTESTYVVKITKLTNYHNLSCTLIRCNFFLQYLN